MFVGLFEMFRVGDHLRRQNGSDMLDTHGRCEMVYLRPDPDTVDDISDGLFQP